MSLSYLLDYLGNIQRLKRRNITADMPCRHAAVTSLTENVNPEPVLFANLISKVKSTFFHEKLFLLV